MDLVELGHIHRRYEGRTQYDGSSVTTIMRLVEAVEALWGRIDKAERRAEKAEADRRLTEVYAAGSVSRIAELEHRAERAEAALEIAEAVVFKMIGEDQHVAGEDTLG